MKADDRIEQSAITFDDLSGAWLDGDGHGTYPVASDGVPDLDLGMSALDVYMARLRTLEPLSDEEQNELARRYVKGDDERAGKLLVMTNLRLVIKLAKDYMNDWSDMLELVQEGNVGINRALEHYDPSKNVKFTSYAQYWIRARILDYLIDRGRTIRLGASRAGRKIFYNLNEVREKLRDQGLDPTPERIAEQLDVDVEEVVRVGRHMDYPLVSLDATRTDNGERTLHELLEAGGASPEETTFDREARDTIRRAIRDFGETLSEDRRRAIWFERTIADEPKLLRELGDDWDVSKERIRQIEKELLHEFRGFFERRMGGRERVEQLMAH